MSERDDSNVFTLHDEKGDNTFVTSKSGGGGGDMLEARVARLESDVQNINANAVEIKQDVRDLRSKQWAHFLITWGGLIGLGLGLAGIMAKGFGWL
jgi:hypothetical protein